MKEVRLSTIL